jgi:excinuclease ABC subunit A
MWMLWFHNKLVVITGLSGSGKSSLAFDTLYAEGQRRYVESLSSARQFLGRLDKPSRIYQGIAPAMPLSSTTNAVLQWELLLRSMIIWNCYLPNWKNLSPISGQEKNTVTMWSWCQSFDLESKWLLLHQFIWKKGQN